MHEPRALLAPQARAALARRGYRLDALALQDLLRRRAGTVEALGKLRAEHNRLARESRNYAATGLRDRTAEVRGQLRAAESNHDAVRDELTAFLLAVPNVPVLSTPDSPPWTVAPATVDGVAPLAYLLACGYTRRAVPPILTETVAPAAPARTEGEPLGALDRLPLALLTHRDGMLHLVRICAAADAGAELAVLVRHAAGYLTRLGLACRVVRRPAAALDFAARATADLEVWRPDRQAHQRISACTDCGTFLAMRAGIRVRGGAEPHPATLHAALPVSGPSGRGKPACP